MPRRKYSPSTNACLIRWEYMVDLREQTNEPFEIIEGRNVLTPQEVAFILDVSTTTVGNMVKEGRLQGLNLRRAVRFLEDEVLAFIGVPR